METFDVVVVGAGPGGYVAAIRAAQLGLSVAVVEERWWGGVCLNVGCIPSKALLRNAEVLNLVTRDAARFGLSGEMTGDYGAAHRRSREVADGRVDGVHFLMRKNGITEVHGRAAFTGEHDLAVTTADGTTRELRFGHAIVATGARPRTLPGVRLSERVVTYETQILDDRLPERMCIIGAGAIGMEFAYVLNAYGVEVTVVEYAARPLPLEDAEVSREVGRAFHRLGVRIVTGARVERVEESGDVVTVGWGGDAPGEVEVDRVLVAVGFAPNTEGLGLELAGVRLDERGAVPVDARMRTNVPHVHAIGDVTMKLQLAHVAEAQGIVAAETIARSETVELGDYRMMPRATFCQPQVASFGLTREQAEAEGHRVVESRFPFSANGKAQGLGAPEGFAKLLVDAEHGEVLGAHLVGHDVSELLPELTLAQRWEIGAAELARNVHTHPTLSEALQELFHGVLGHQINA